MQITILESFHRDGVLHVRFSNSLGAGIAEWTEDVPPNGYRTDVELDVPESLTWGREITLATETGYFMAEERGTTHFSAQVEVIYDDGCTALRLDDSILLLETEGPPYPVGAFVTVRPPHLVLFEVRL